MARKEDLDPRNHSDRVLHREVYFKGADIITQGESGFRAYYIEKGRVDVLVKEGAHEVKVNELSRGDIFGEMALINHEPRSATVRVADDCTVTIISRDDIEGKIERILDPAIRALIEVLVKRIHDATQAQVRQYAALASFQDRIAGVVDSVAMGIDEAKRDKFRKEVEPLLEKMQQALGKYKSDS